MKYYPIDISIHALLAESDVTVSTLKILAILFLSTLSLRRATPQSAKVGTGVSFLSTLSLRRATHYSTTEETKSLIFLSTLSLRRATL